MTSSNAGGLFQVFEVFSAMWILTLVAVHVDAAVLEPSRPHPRQLTMVVVGPCSRSIVVDKELRYVPLKLKLPTSPT